MDCPVEGDRRGRQLNRSGGSYEQVAESLLDYVAVGATTLLIRGYDPLGDAAAYANLVRLVHESVGDDLRGFRAEAVA